MRNTKGGGMPAQSGDQDQIYRTVVSDLASVVEHVRKSLKLIEAAIASEAAAEEVVADNVIVLDDVTPGYARADAVLRECDAGLSIALRLLQGSMVFGDGPSQVAGGGSLPPAFWPISA